MEQDAQYTEEFNAFYKPSQASEPTLGVSNNHGEWRKTQLWGQRSGRVLPQSQGRRNLLSCSFPLEERSVSWGMHGTKHGMVSTANIIQEPKKVFDALFGA